MKRKHEYKVLITNDSFGMHVGLALKKRCIILFGATNYQEVYLYKMGVSLYPKDFECKEFPCRVNRCVKFRDTCTSLIKPEMVLSNINKMMKKREATKSLERNSSQITKRIQK